MAILSFHIACGYSITLHYLHTPSVAFYYTCTQIRRKQAIFTVRTTLIPSNSSCRCTFRFHTSQMSQKCCRMPREPQWTWEWFISMRRNSGPRLRLRIEVVRLLDWRNSGKNQYYYSLRLIRPTFCECGQYAANCMIYTWLNMQVTVSSEMFENLYNTTRRHTHHQKFL